MIDDVQGAGTDMVYVPSPPSPPPPPTPEQLARAAALRSFNRRVLYLPLGTIILFWAALLLVMLWLSLFSDSAEQLMYRALFSGVADVVLIGLFAFWLLLGMIPIGITVFIWWKARERRLQRPPGPDPLPIMWRLENVVVMVSERIAAFLPLLARPFILAHGISSYIRTLFIEVKKMLTRS